MKLDVEHLDDLSLGATFLATGGGGDPYVSCLAARKVLQQHGPAELITADDLDDGAYVVAIGDVGAPSVSLELLPSVDDASNAVRAFEKHVGRRVDAVVSFEVGGGNSLVPIMAAAELGIPVIDGDGMGRALPEAQMMTFPIAGIAPTPAVGINYAGEVETFDADSATAYEKLVRQKAESMGGMITTVEHPMTGAQVKASIVPGTISFAIKIGRLLRKNRGSAERIIAPLQQVFSDSLYGSLFHLYSGKITDYASTIVGGFDVGEACVEAFDSGVPPLVINIRNEYLLARIGEDVVASVPDLVTVLDYETSEPINAERLRYGQRVAVFGIGCPEFYRQERALDVVAPRCFGFDIDYVAIEDLVASYRSG
ncbi:MAG: DUF917 domain-containing protein [Woeseiaceae bacterium]|nr:DUF917 domain-containing protein [Woeseiaceae bacterium]